MGAPPGAAGAQPWEGPHRPVTLRHGLWMADSPVTQALWAAVTGEHPSGFGDPSTPELPVEQVCWVEADAFCRRLAARLGLPAAAEGAPAWGPRLPTEAEWEYACRAGGPPDLSVQGPDPATRPPPRPAGAPGTVEADHCDLFYAVIDAGAHFVIRLSADRKVADPKRGQRG